MATKKTAAYYSSQVTKAVSAYNKSKTTLDKNKKTVATLEAKLAKASAASKNKIKTQISKAKKSVTKAGKTVDSKKTAVTAAKKKQSDFKSAQAKEKRQEALDRKKKIIEIMKTTKPGYWKAKRPYILPRYPGTLKSWVFVDNTSETETSQTEITTNSIAPGQYVNHYTQTQPIQRQIEGKLGGALSSEVPGLKKQYNNLRRWEANGTEVEFHGQKMSTSAVITSSTANFDAPRDNAISVSISLQDVKWATSGIKKKSNTTTKKKPANDTGKKNPKKGDRDKNGTYLTIKKGDTYWGYNQKYGTSIAKLRAWNGFPDKALPIGKKIRVK